MDRLPEAYVSQLHIDRLGGKATRLTINTASRYDEEEKDVLIGVPKRISPELMKN